MSKMYVCMYGALAKNSEEISIKELLVEIEKDKRFYQRTGGGVTFSGGEPLMQADGLQAALLRCKSQGMHTAVETAGNYLFSVLEPLLDSIDLVLMDCKAYSEDIHKRCTGHSNKEILNNISRLSSMGKRLWVRIPVVWDVNITLGEMEKIADFLRGKRIEKVELLPYHKMGISKYKMYGKDYRIGGMEPPEEEIGKCYEILKKYQISI